MHQFSRTELLIGQDGLTKLAQSKVAIFGVGGVGSFTVEALARAGIGHLVIVDFDSICLTNINRQLPALHSTVGRSKVEVLAERLADINPQLQVTALREFVTPENVEQLVSPDLAYVVDAVDNVTAKLALLTRSRSLGIPAVSAMGAGNRLDPTRLRIADISQTSGCALARVMRRELRKRGISNGLTVVFSDEAAITPQHNLPGCKDNCICPDGDAHCAIKRQIPGSISFVPSVAGLLLASQVINDLLKKPKTIDFS